jgi:hypothetical protein
VFRQYEERRRFDPIEGSGYGVLAGFHDVVGDDRIRKLFSQVLPPLPPGANPTYEENSFSCGVVNLYSAGVADSSTISMFNFEKICGEFSNIVTKPTQSN